MLYQPTDQPMTEDEAAAGYCECLLDIEALTIAERSGCYAPEILAAEKDRISQFKDAFAMEMRRHIHAKVSAHGSEPPLSIPDF